MERQDIRKVALTAPLLAATGMAFLSGCGTDNPKPFTEDPRLRPDSQTQQYGPQIPVSMDSANMQTARREFMEEARAQGHGVVLMLFTIYRPGIKVIAGLVKVGSPSPRDSYLDQHAEILNISGKKTGETVMYRLETATCDGKYKLALSVDGEKPIPLDATRNSTGNPIFSLDPDCSKFFEITAAVKDIDPRITH